MAIAHLHPHPTPAQLLLLFFVFCFVPFNACITCQVHVQNEARATCMCRMKPHTKLMKPLTEP